MKIMQAKTAMTVLSKLKGMKPMKVVIYLSLHWTHFTLSSNFGRPAQVRLPVYSGCMGDLRVVWGPDAGIQERAVMVELIDTLVAEVAVFGARGPVTVRRNMEHL